MLEVHRIRLRVELPRSSTLVARVVLDREGTSGVWHSRRGAHHGTPIAVGFCLMWPLWPGNGHGGWMMQWRSRRRRHLGVRRGGLLWEGGVILVL
jgi:hypothetical protein